MDRNEKQQQVAYITDRFQNAKSVIFANYRGLNVTDITELRNKLTEADSVMKVIKNRLAKRAAADSKIEGFDECLSGPTAMASSDVDPVLPAKVLVDFAKDHKVLEIKAGYMDGKLLDVATINRLAALPSRDVLLSQALSSMSAPATNLAMVLAALPRGLVTAIDGIRKQKEEQQ